MCGSLCARHAGGAQDASGPARRSGDGVRHLRGAIELFTARWVKLGFSLKAYGYHMWANLPVLFRKLGSLEGMCQSVVEGTIGKIARLLPHLQMKAVGRYSKEVEAGGTAAKLAELERRRAIMNSPAQTIMEELMMDTFEAKYGISTSDKYALPL
eukprot:7388256-Prymnesium_polylepis.1